ncbi:MAG: 2,3-bisphosphoglycerate-independent phosphoglycerate mutase [Peptostreptococcaceae bacterium]|nr:2,3-bisphosphoglycerate-independent phosphoglycerate mutase [Peptostreptococcaceae bacterium]MDY5739464.1 2,3-bisphosphoglycerate-independent phosphoglycerate mutase [Anaerovoracaceae bacterium]
MNTRKKPAMLMILDGFGINESSYGNAIAQAETPNIDEIFNKYPHTRLLASGLAVGLPEGQMGNSEVGHLNIGAGRVVYQELTRISKEIEDGDFFKNTNILMAMEQAKNKNAALHLMGLLSDGGVHSHIDHLIALLHLAKRKGLDRVYVHCFLDGRDVPPTCAGGYIATLEDEMSKLQLGKIATISGRYYAMDRDKRWDRIQLAYDTMTLGESMSNVLVYDSAEAALEDAYNRGEADEFVKPSFISGSETISSDDSIIMFNFRPDRAREITRAFVDKDFSGFKRIKTCNDLSYVTMTRYDATIDGVSIAYPPETISNTFGEYISKLGLKQLRIAETEKYAHVTFFFNGGVEEPEVGEDRILVPSPKVPTYDMQPEMSAPAVCERVIEAIESDKYDVIILNFANPDMVGHTGVMEAAVKAIETMDRLVPKITAAVLARNGQLLLTADHGNADVMLDENGNVVTSHSLNQVPLVHISNEPRALADGGKLCDIAPTLLKLMGLPIPAEMTGRSLV